MSEEQAVDDGPYMDGLVNQEESIPEQEEEQAPAKAEISPKGHMSREAWEAKGNDPDKYRTPEEFEAAGPTMRQLDRFKLDLQQATQDAANTRAEHQDQIRNLNIFHKGQLEQTIADLEGRRNNAIDEADTAVANQLQSQIDTARDNKTLIETREAVQQHQQPPKDADVIAWEARNPWINDTNDIRTAGAIKAFVSYQKQGYDSKQALAMVDNDLSRSTPNVNHARSTAAVAEGTQGPGATSRTSSNSVTMKSLTHDEKVAWDNFGHSYDSQKAFLKAVSNSRIEDAK